MATTLPPLLTSSPLHEPLCFDKRPLSPPSTDSESTSSRSPSLLTSLFQNNNLPQTPVLLTPTQRPIINYSCSSTDNSPPSSTTRTLKFEVRSPPFHAAKILQHEFNEITEELDDSFEDDGYEEDSEGGFTDGDDDGQDYSSFKPQFEPTRLPIYGPSFDIPRGRKVSIADLKSCLNRCSRHRSPPPTHRSISPPPPAARSPSAMELCKRRESLRTMVMGGDRKVTRQASLPTKHTTVRCPTPPTFQIGRRRGSEPLTSIPGVVVRGEVSSERDASDSLARCLRIV